MPQALDSGGRIYTPRSEFQEIGGRHVLEHGESRVSIRDRWIGNAPVDAQVRIVPAHPPLSLSRVVVAALVVKECTLAEHGKAMGKARGKAGGEAGATPPSLNLPHRTDFPQNHYHQSRVKHPESMSMQRLELDIGVFQ